MGSFSWALLGDQNASAATASDAQANTRSAFNAIIAGSVVALDLSYAMPIAVNCLRGRNTLPERKWRLPGWLGWTADIVSLAYISLTTVLFLFPPGLPVTGTNMSAFL